jgi:hypothetical protein
MVWGFLLRRFGAPGRSRATRSSGSTPETVSIAAVDFVDPRPRGGSLLNHDSGSELGEPLNV